MSFTPDFAPSFTHFTPEPLGPSVAVSPSPKATQRRTARRPCDRCGRLVEASRLVLGLGSGCAQMLGLTMTTPRVRSSGQDGPDLFAAEEDDHCDGRDRP